MQLSKIQHFTSHMWRTGGINKSKFTKEEDDKLRDLVNQYGIINWQIIADKMPKRNVRQCRERWNHYLTPQISNGEWSSEEDKLLLEKYEKYGNQWKFFEKFFPTRSSIHIRNRWRVLNRQQERLRRKDGSEISSPVKKSNVIEEIFPLASERDFILEFETFENMDLNEFLLFDQTY